MLEKDGSYSLDPEVQEEMANTVIFIVKKVLEFQKKSMNKHRARGETVPAEVIISSHTESFLGSLVMSLSGTLTQQAEPEVLIKCAVQMLNNIITNLTNEDLEFSVNRMEVGKLNV
jgi:hypothetical protein